MQQYEIYFLLITLYTLAPSYAQTALNVMTFNIRWDNEGDSLNGWSYRRDKVAGQILFHKTHMLGVQEATHKQMMDLQQDLGHFDFTGVGRSDGKTGGEYSAIFFDKDRLALLESETFWLSETPDIAGTKSWDAAIERIVTWGKFQDKNTGKVFFLFNTHFDHMGEIARLESAKLLLQKLKAISNGFPCIVMGDFNAEPKTEPIQYLTNKNDGQFLFDAKEISASGHYGPEGTFNGFEAKETSNEPIDYIFVNKYIQVEQHATFSQSWGGRFSSDHFPVYAVVSIQ